MNYRSALRRQADGGLSSDMSMDPSGQDTHQDDRGSLAPAPPVDDDGQDPATPGGPSPYNGTTPFSEPVTSDPEWLDPQGDPGRGKAIPHIEDPNVNEDRSTLHPASLHNARAASYQAKHAREGAN